jgi:hypothetical protein
MVVKGSILCFMMLSPSLFLFCGAILLTLNGCSKKADVKSQVSELEKTFRDTSAAAPPGGERSLADQSGSPPDEAKAYVNFALSAVRTNDFAGGVIALQTAQRMPMLTAAQHRAVYQAMQAMTADLVARAEKGDAKAKADLAAIERTRSQ